MDMSEDELKALVSKTEKNELRARDAEARLRVIRAEIALFEERQKLEKLRSGS